MYNYDLCGARVFELSLMIKLLPVILYLVMNGPFVAQLFTSMHLLQLASKLTLYYLTYECCSNVHVHVCGTRLIDKHVTCMVVFCVFLGTTPVVLISC